MKKNFKRAKDTARSALSQSAVVLAGALYSLGLDAKDEDLRSRFNVSLSIITGKISKSGLITLTKEMIKAANENMDKLQKYSVTPEFISAMEKKLESFEKIQK